MRTGWISPWVLDACDRMRSNRQVAEEWHRKELACLRAEAEGRCPVAFKAVHHEQEIGE